MAEFLGSLFGVEMDGKICTVRLIDSIGQIHLEESGLALIPGVDEYEVIG